jgi:hypothetical protein
MCLVKRPKRHAMPPILATVAMVAGPHGIGLLTAMAGILLARLLLANPKALPASAAAIGPYEPDKGCLRCAPILTPNPSAGIRNVQASKHELAI